MQIPTCVFTDGAFMPSAFEPNSEKNIDNPININNGSSRCEPRVRSKDTLGGFQFSLGFQPELPERQGRVLIGPA